MERNKQIYNVVKRHLGDDFKSFKEQEGANGFFLNLGSEDGLFMDRYYKNFEWPDSRLKDEIKRVKKIMKTMIIDLKPIIEIVEYDCVLNETYLGKGSKITIYIHWKK